MPRHAKFYIDFSAPDVEIVVWKMVPAVIVLFGGVSWLAVVVVTF